MTNPFLSQTNTLANNLLHVGTNYLIADPYHRIAAAGGVAAYVATHAEATHRERLDGVNTQLKAERLLRNMIRPQPQPQPSAQPGSGTGPNPGSNQPTTPGTTRIN